MEEMLISTVMPIMSIYRYKLPLGQYGYTGHVISSPEDVTSFAHSLARLPSKLDVLVERKEQDQSHCSLRRHAVVQEALEWLLKTNKFYRVNQIRLNEDVLQ